MIAIALAVAFAAILLAAPRAHAGSYVVAECGVLNPQAPDVTWQSTGDRYGRRSQCGDGDGLQIFHAADSSPPGELGAWQWSAPAGTTLTTVQANASLVTKAGHRAELFAGTAAGETIVFGAEHGDFRVHSARGNFTRFGLRLRCASATGCGRAAEDSAHAYVRGVHMRVEDSVAPALSPVGGSLFGDPVVRGVRGLLFTAGDAGGGIRTVSIEANGRTLLTDARNCGLVEGFATALAPCPGATTESAAIATAGPEFVTGPNVIDACAADLALDGTPNRTCVRSRIWVDNVCPVSAAGAATALEASFAGRSTARVRSDRGAVIAGHLAGADADATVCALTRERSPGAPVVLAATASTDAGGRFRLELRPGPSRSVFVHHAAGDTVLARHGLRLRSAVRPALRVRPRSGLRNHDRLRFTGRLPGPRCARRVVKIQARVGPHRWQVFRSERSDATCRFATRYKLRSTRGARRYRFRALVPRQAGYPYERGASAIVRVRVGR